MLNQFYNYLANKLAVYFEGQSLKGGERFYLQFDDQKEVAEFYKSLKNLDWTENFSYKHERGSQYSTFAINPNGVKVVVAATVNNVTPDFLVTLRNKVGEQKGEWENTALLSICHETLDSIRGGSSDVQKEGMPLHVKSITKKLEEEIDKSELNKAEKEVAKYYLKQKLDDMVLQPELFDFAEVLGLLSQGSITKKDYRNLSLFYDEKLDQFTATQIRKRLEENNNLFKRVQHIHEYENLDQHLERSFDDRGVSKLKKDDWQDLDYSFVKTSHENYLQVGKKYLEYYESPKKLTEQGLIYWEKPVKETKTGQKKRHIIVFNPEKRPLVSILFSFEGFLKKDFIHKNSEPYAEASGKKLRVNLPHSQGTSFYRIQYKHNGQANSAYEFYIAIVECDPSFLQSVQTVYEVNTKTGRLAINSTGESLIIGRDKDNAQERLIEEHDSIIELHSDSDTIAVSTAGWDEDLLFFRVKTEDFEIPFMIKDQIVKSTPVLGKRIWKLKREQQSHFIYVNGKLQQGAREYYPREEFTNYLEIEKSLLEKQCYFAKKTASGVIAQELVLPQSLKEAYDKLVCYYKEQNLVPSLAYLSEDFAVLSKEYVQAFIDCVNGIQENALIGYKQKNILKLGMIEDNGAILLSPLHPLNVAYQLTLSQQVGSEQIDQHILDRLHPGNLLPYIYGKNDQIYRSVTQHDACEWIMYKPLNEVTVGESSTFMASVIEEKLQQFIEHFNYLFLPGAKSPLRVNVINITNDKEVLRGLMNFIIKQVEKNGPHKVIPLEVALYQEAEMVSAFEKLSKYDDVEKIEEKFEVSLTSKNLDPVDMLRIVRENINYYKLLDTGAYNYAHISFYKMMSHDSDAKDNTDEIETGISLNGLVSSVSTVNGRQDYRAGFGIKNVLDSQNTLIETAKLLNELACNLHKDGSSPYRKNLSIVTRTTAFKEERLNKLYDSSYWVTFIDPNVDLEFFQRVSRDLLIIHYSDQYTSSDQYDAITVTDKSIQYKNIIKQYLDEKAIPTKEEEVNSAIRAFNTINGEWLLRIIGSKGQFSREKLSIISAIKYTLSFLDHDNILWIPISLEEILRVAGAVKLTKSEGIFSAKNLGVRGATSDDLLLIGLEYDEEDKLFIHYYPVEVKVGINDESTIRKAKEQIASTHKLINAQLRTKEDNGKKLFRNTFFRNFFIQMFMANAQKFVVNELWPEKNFDVIQATKARLLNDEYEVGNHLRPYIGDGMVLSFKKEASWRSARKEENIVLLQLTEEDAYSGVVEGISALRQRIHSGDSDIQTSDLLVNLYVPDVRPGIVEYLNPEPELITVAEGEVAAAEDEIIPEVVSKPKELIDIRILLGTVAGSTKKIYWEYGHPNLANRHILISGKSGQGKTYFIQCLLLELAMNNISGIIFDYTGGFKKSKLEPEFKEVMQEKLEQILVVRDKFPINPFKRNMRELDEGEYIEEDFSDVADRMKSVFAAVYKDLGIQQLNAIYQATMRGLQKYGNGMNLEMLRLELEEESSGPAKTALSQLNPLIDKNPFDSTKDYDWAKLEADKGKVFVIQLTGFASEAQKVITEFILWDLWYNKLQHGDQSKPLPVILDEAQNLDHSEKSPSAKILTEGRKFGWSGWYATQFLRGLLSTDEIARLQNSSQKIYFLPPENEISSIASNLAHDNAERKEWEKRLASLNKGQCVAHGPILKNGTLQQSEPVIVNIDSLSERLKDLLRKD